MQFVASLPKFMQTIFNVQIFAESPDLNIICIKLDFLF